MESIIFGAALGAAFAGSGWLAAHFIATGIRNAKQLTKRPSWPYSVGIALAIACTAAFRPYVQDHWYGYTIDARADELMVGLESSAPVYRAIRQNEPTLYDQVRLELIESVKRGDSQDETITKVRSHLSTYVGANMMLAPDEVLVRMVSVSVQEARALSQSNPDLCVGLLKGELVGDIRPFIPDELEREEMAAMEALILAPKSMVRPAMSEDEASQLSFEIILRKIEETGIPFNDFAEASGGKLEPARACIALVEFMSGITELPPQQAGAMFRSLNSGNATAAGSQ